MPDMNWEITFVRHSLTYSMQRSRTITTTSTFANEHRAGSHEELSKERIKLCAESTKLTHQRDAIASKVRDLPWVKVDKDYTFGSPSGKKSLADLFGPHDQLIVYHFMFVPTWSQGCKSC